jgi:hypothetical protein
MQMLPGSMRRSQAGICRFVQPSDGRSRVGCSTILLATLLHLLYSSPTACLTARDGALKAKGSQCAMLGPKPCLVAPIFDCPNSRDRNIPPWVYFTMEMELPSRNICHMEGFQGMLRKGGPMWSTCLSVSRYHRFDIAINHSQVQEEP